MPQLMTDVGDVTNEWITDVFRRNGYLSSGEAQHVAVERIHDEQLQSIGYFLRVVWSPDAPPTLPTRLFLKLPRHADSPDTTAGVAEVQTYQRFAPYRARMPLVPCYDAVYAPQQGYHLLLLDLSETHDQPSWHLEIADRYIEQTVDCLARLHGFWWNSDALHNVSSLPTPAHLQAERTQIETWFAGFVDALGEQLAPHDRLVFERMVGMLPMITARRANPERPTLVHGDAHFWNFLYPRDSSNRTFILDWQLQHIDWGVNDLAYTVGLRYPHRTGENERALVRRYHRAITEQGVAYAWEDCWNDYRRAVVEQLTIPVLSFAGGMPEALWSMVVPRALAAFHDLECAELLR